MWGVHAPGHGRHYLGFCESWRQKNKMAVNIDKHFDGSFVSRDHFLHVLLAVPPHFETENIWCSAFRDHVFSSHPVVRDFCTSCVPRCIHRYPRKPVDLPVQNNTFHVNVLNNNCPSEVFVSCLWHCAILTCVRGIALHHIFPVAISILWCLQFITVVVVIAEMKMLMYF